MLKQIADLVEFDQNVFTEDQIIQEFNHKFSGTTLKVDGKYVTVTYLKYALDELYLRWITPDFREEVFLKINTIEKVMPKAGLYASEYGLLYLFKLPKRQWLKSIKLENNYNILVLAQAQDLEDITLFNTVLIDEPNYKKESIIYKKKVYLHWKAVGHVIEDTIYVTNHNFFEEMKELWSPQYLVSLEAKPRKQKEEKLILDF